MKRILIALLLLAAISAAISAQTPAKKTITAFTEKMQKIDGFLPLYVNADDSRVYIEVTQFNREFLYLVSLPTGVVRCVTVTPGWSAATRSHMPGNDSRTGSVSR